MAKYEVLKAITDSADNNHFYSVGSEYPRKGYSPSAERIKELSTDDNMSGTPVIKEKGEVKKTTKRTATAKKPETPENKADDKLEQKS